MQGVPKLDISLLANTRELPVIRQSEMAECGLACLAMISSHHGHEYDLATLRAKFPMALTGANLKSLIELAEKLDLSARPLKVPLEQMAGLKAPAILHWDLNHFVVLERVGKTHADIIDPARGRVKLDVAEVSKHYTGIALELQPTHDFVFAKEVDPVSFSELWSRIRGIGKSMVSVFFASVLLILFSLISPLYVQTVVDDVIIGRDANLLYVLAFGFAFVLLFETAIKALRGFLVLVMSSSLYLQIADNVFRHLLHLPLSYFEKRHLGDVVSRFGSIEKLKEIFTSRFVESIVDGLLATAMLVVLMLYSVHLAGLALVAGLLYLVMRLLLFKPIREATESAIRERAAEQTSFMESVRGIQTIKLFGKEALRRSVWKNQMVGAVNRDMMVGRHLIVFQLLSGLIFGLEAIISIYLGATLILESKFTIGMLYAFLAYKALFVNSSRQFIESIFEFLMAKLHLQRVSDILRTSMETPPSVAHEAPRKQGSLELTNVSYSFTPGGESLFKDVTFKIGFGECIALIGPSGAGKTTLLKILAGLHQPTTGRMSYDGHAVTVENLRHYRSHVAAVTQDGQLFAGSILDNIGFFDPTIDRQFAEQCARAACIHDEIMRMPMGYNTLVGDMGSTLSGDQKQRVLLARALYHRPAILLMDEATSHLDVANESAVNNALRAMNITRIIVAHRESSIQSADRLLFVYDRSVCEVHRQQSQAQPAA
jgi:ATP-binding cassette subfamily B protein RaxB